MAASWSRLAVDRIMYDSNEKEKLDAPEDSSRSAAWYFHADPVGKGLPEKDAILTLSGFHEFFLGRRRALCLNTGKQFHRKVCHDYEQTSAAASRFFRKGQGRRPRS
jgi:hypothetical protein